MNVNVDEIKVFHQYLPSKPIKWGAKVWVLAESDTGYLSGNTSCCHAAGGPPVWTVCQSLLQQLLYQHGLAVVPAYSTGECMQHYPFESMQLADCTVAKECQACKA